MAVSIASQAKAVEQVAASAHACMKAISGKSTGAELLRQHLLDAVATLLWCEDNRAWIAEARRLRQIAEAAE
jgi:hypothetical protein